MLGVQLVIYATRRQTQMEHRELADSINNYGRSAIGESAQERVIIHYASIRKYLKCRF